VEKCSSSLGRAWDRASLVVARSLGEIEFCRQSVRKVVVWAENT